MIRTSGRASLIAVFTAGLLHLYFSTTHRYLGSDGEAWRTAISSDGDGYYAYLTGLFVDGGLRHASAADNHFAPAGDGRIIKYLCGTAVVQLPFFLAAHAWCAITGVDANGRTLPYQVAIGLCSLCVMLFGLWQLRALLRSFQLPDGAVAFTLWVLVAGTGLLYQAVMTPSMSHAASFAAIAWALNEARRAWLGLDRHAIVRAALAIALITLIRPVDLLALFALPVVAMDKPIGLLAWVKRQGVRRWLIAAIVLLFIISLQPLAWYAQCGRFFVVPYANEGFHWSAPKLFQVLFSARKGLFFYWPMLLLALPGLLVLWERSRLVAASIFIAFGTVAYVASCWWTWYYGHSYGMRPMLDHLVLFAIPIAFLHGAIPRRWKHVLLVLTIPLLLLQCFQIWQYQQGILHPFNMDREKYRTIFLRSGDEHRDLFGEGCASPPYAPRGFDVLVDTLLRRPEVPWQLDSADRFGPGVIVAPAELPSGQVLYVEASLRRRALDANASNTVEMVCTLGQGGTNWYYNAYRLNDIRLPDDRTWRHWRYAFYVPAAKPGDEMRVYTVQNGTGRVLLKDVDVRISAVRR